MNAPPVVDKDVEDAKEKDEEAGAPLCLESNGHHDASTETDERDDDASERPRALEDEADEEEDEEDTTGKLEAESKRASKLNDPLTTFSCRSR